MPEFSGLGTVKMILKDGEGHVLYHNFMNFVIKFEKNKPNTTILEIAAKDFKNRYGL